MPQLILISAMSSDRIIGTPDGMPWSVPEEYQQYLSFVRGNPIIMGRRSFEIFGPDLPGESLFVVSRSLQTITGARVCSSLDQAIEEAKAVAEHGKIFIAGGGSIYEKALPLANAMYLSTIKGSYEGTVYFPEFSDENWNVEEEREEARFTFRRYVRK